MLLFDDIRLQKKEFRRVGGIFLLAAVLFGLCNWGIAAVFNAGLKRYYYLYPARVLCVGHSMSEMGIDRTYMVRELDMPVAKYCLAGAGPAERAVMIEHYVEATGAFPEIIVYDASTNCFSSNLATGAYKLLVPFINQSAAVDRYVRRKSSWEDYWLEKLVPLSRYEVTRLSIAWRGWTSDWKNRQTMRFEPERFLASEEQQNIRRIDIDPAAVQEFDRTMELLHRQGVKVMLLRMPNIDLIERGEPETYAQVLEIFQSTARRYDNVVFYDYGRKFSTDYSLFMDPIHLNPLGQQRITGELIADLKPLLTGGKEAGTSDSEKEMNP